ncbi:RnfABCDGE type electron transport complex subunit G [Clostridium sp.]|jgi:electron transport complex protein RnfG|uniref:RnfABCDGE type electron transport complex subunit G n=1 Tax=Clostridium sp. TaxID=1506 RepID=UPI002842F36C|nr:RnfABCDGE type electron transport complex subunit G [Clostridium sp.]MDR3595315.1 RnfABCDGE type electron transport complex subunit G [Clostridium sp.]
MEGAHVKKEYSIFQVAINLIGACLISGLILGVVYYITAPIAAEKNELLKQQSMKELVSDADNFKAVPDKEQWFAAEKGGKVIAYVVPSESKGYGGEIKMLVAISTDGKVIDYNILSSNETPGLGDNASKEPFRSQFKGKKEANLTVVKDPSDKEDIQAMTGATISSRAVTLAVKNAVNEVTELTGGK